MNWRFSLVGFILVLSACATTENFKMKMNSWVGSHVDRLVASYGPPQSSTELSDGGKVIEYVRSRTDQYGGGTYTVPHTTYHSGSGSAYGSGGGYAQGTYGGTSTTYIEKQHPTYTVTQWCKVRFRVNSRGIITAWRAQGNNCVALPPK